MKHHVGDRREAGFSVVDAPPGWKPEMDSWSGPELVVTAIAAIVCIGIGLHLVFGLRF